jgi:hypothetical protein
VKKIIEIVVLVGPHELASLALFGSTLFLLGALVRSLFE